MKNKVIFIIISFTVLGGILAELFKKAKPKFILPIKAGRITSRFHEKRGSKLHNGLDIAPIIAGTKNEPCLATAGGTVSKVWNDAANGGGLSVLINHGLGYVSGYAHLASQAVRVGQKVKQGEKIGIVGTSGESTGVHVHFTITLLGVKIDPETVIN